MTGKKVASGPIRIKVIYSEVQRRISIHKIKKNKQADNFLERHREDYEKRKAAWLRRKKHLPKIKKPAIQRPDDEAL